MAHGKSIAFNDTGDRNLYVLANADLWGTPQ